MCRKRKLGFSGVHLRAVAKKRLIDIAGKPNTKPMTEEKLEEEVLKFKEQGNAAFKEGKFEEALQHYNKALELSPSNIHLYGNRAAVFIRMNQHDKALADADKAIAINPNWGRAHHRRGTALHHQEKYLEAKKAFLTGLHYEPDNEAIKKSLDETNEKIQQKGLVCRKVTQSVDCFECSLCLKLFFEPVTTPCGHTFCRVCLARALDHTTTCPLCRSTMHYNKEHPVNVTIQDILQKFFADEYNSRSEELKEVALQTEDQMPLFLLNTVAFPGVPFPMHIFEPRYRLMLRRCMEGHKRFGLVGCKKNSVGEWIPCNVGTCLHIRDTKLLEDGRSYIDTIGLKRFKILEHWDLDGYKVAKVEWYEDMVPTPEQAKKGEELAATIRQKILDRSDKHTQCGGLNQLAEILQKYAEEMPTEADTFSFWLAAYLPITGWFKQHILETTSTIDRLSRIDEVLSIKPKD